MARSSAAAIVALFLASFAGVAAAQKAEDERSVCLNRSGSHAFDEVREACEVRIAEGGDAEALYEAHISFGIAFGDHGEFGRAADEFTQAIRLLPDETAGYNNRGIAYRNLGNYDAAIADYGEALRINPRHARALNNRCWARAVTARDLELALADCDASLRIEADPNTNGTRCLVHLQMQHYQAALQDCDIAHHGAPGEARSLYGRGLARKGLGMAAESQRDLEAALALDPSVADEYASFGIHVPPE